MAAYYNEIDPFAAQWLRNLIKSGHIADGVVDERSIEDVRPNDLKGFTQCHFFAGIGVWSLALRNAGWADDRPVWTGSCPCQPFSAAGSGAGFADERHLWPAFFHLIQECKSAVVFGEQVASKDAEPWIDLVQTDLEAVGYAVGAVAFPSASVGAPHIRDRLYWAGHAHNARSQGHWQSGNLNGAQGWKAAGRHSAASSMAGRMADMHSDGCNQARQCSATIRGNGAVGIHSPIARQPATGPTNGFWRNADWLLCRDGKWRPVEAGTFPLAHGVASRVGRLRAYGNAINAKAAQTFIECVIQAAA